MVANEDTFLPLGMFESSYPLKLSCGRQFGRSKSTLTSSCPLDEVHQRQVIDLTAAEIQKSVHPSLEQE